MKKIILITLTAAAVSLGFNSCDLDRFPYSEIELSQGMQTVSDVRKLTDGSYSILRAGTYGRHMMTQDIQSDIFHATLSYGNRYGLPYSWDNFNSTDYDLEAQWEFAYLLITNVNNIIANHETVTLENESEENLMAQYLGEAYMMRAIAYSRLIERFAKDYEPASAASDPGVPVLLEFDIDNKPPRSSVQEVYDQIFADIAAAKAQFAKVDWDKATATALAGGSNMRFTPDAATAFEARMYLYTHQWDKAITAAESVISSNKYPLTTTEEDFVALWVDDQGTEIIMHLYGDEVKEGMNTNGNYTSYSNSEKTYMPDYLPEQWVVDLYGDGDHRKAAYLLNADVQIEAAVYTDLYVFNKYPRTTRFSASGDTRHYPMLFRSAELYLIVAEAAVHNSNAAGLKRLNELRVARGLEEISALSLDAVKEERTKELMGEGVRLSDLKRWNMPLSRGAAQKDDAVIPGNKDKQVAAGADKFVWAIPSIDIQLNPNLKNAQNPGW